MIVRFFCFEIELPNDCEESFQKGKNLIINCLNVEGKTDEDKIKFLQYEIDWFESISAFKDNNQNYAFNLGKIIQSLDEYQAFRYKKTS